MNNRHKKKIIAVTSCAVLTALFIITLFFAAPKTEIVPETSDILTSTYRVDLPDGSHKTETVYFEIGKDVTAMRISDLGDLGKITKVNYIADRFENAGSLSKDIQIVDLTKPFEFAEKGTLIFIVMNLDPNADDFDEQSERLSKYRIGEYWQFTVALPEIFSASNVYRNTILVDKHGEIENYDFSQFTTSYDKHTENFSSQTATTYVDLQFYPKRHAMADALNDAKVITIHYQSSGGSYSGIMDTPLIGTDIAVKRVGENSQNLLIAFAIIAAVVFAVFVVLSLLERTKEFISAIVWIFGIFMLLLSRFLLGAVITTPLLWSAISLAASFVILGGALLAMGRNFGKIPTKYLFPALSSFGALFAFIIPFIPFGAASAMRIVCTNIKAICTIALFAFLGLTTFKKEDSHGILQSMCTAAIAVSIAASIFLPQIFPTHINPSFWMCVAVTMMTFISVFLIFAETKKANAYLTTNLHKEVERQVNDIKAVIAERDQLLQFVSHDMKKPLVTSSSLIDRLLERETDSEQTKTLRIVKQNTARVVANLSEIAVYAKLNYIAEPSQVVDLAEVCEELYEFHQPDCNANGIVLKNLLDKRMKAFVKKQGLENVLSNLIINAIEHANCRTITLYIKPDRNNIILCVADDGKGIDANMDIFKPYVSENNSETSGVGLYICKNIIESMNGSLTYESSREGTVFSIALLKA